MRNMDTYEIIPTTMITTGCFLSWHFAIFIVNKYKFSRNATVHVMWPAVKKCQKQFYANGSIHNILSFRGVRNKIFRNFVSLCFDTKLICLSSHLLSSHEFVTEDDDTDE